MPTIHQLKASLKEVEDLKAALDQHAIVAITDPQGQITYVNDRFCAISGYSRGELIGQNHRLVNSGLHPKEFFQEMWSSIGRGRCWHGEIRNKTKGGEFYWVATTIVPFLGEGGKPRQYVAIRTDITERKRAEELNLQINLELEKRVAERTAQLEASNRELEAFSYSVSNDLRAPLRAINGFSQVVVEDFGPQLPPEGQRLLATIRRSAERMGLLIDDLLSFSHLGSQALNKIDIDMDALVRACAADPAFRAEGRRIDLRIGSLAACHGDPALLRQVWANLLSNAHKYTRGRAAASIEIGCQLGGASPVYFIRDNGAGFEMRYADKLFGVFQRLHRAEDYEGTGVGLAIAHRIVTRHGGRIWAEAEPDKGAAFFFTLATEPAP